jgi:hypothetical protein
MSTITNAVLVQKFEVIFHIFDVVRICASGNYAQIPIIKSYNY